MKTPFQSSAACAAATVLLAGICGASPSFAQEAAAIPHGDSPPQYQKLRFDEDFSYLKDPANRTDVWDPIKFIPFNDARDWNLSLGGEARLRYEYYNNLRWNPDSPDKDGYFLQRYLLHADLHMGEAVRVFGQLQSSLADWRAGGARPTDVDRLDVHQFFADFRVPLGDDDDSLTFRLGRQELLYGSQRLVSTRESPNIRRSFDAARVLAKLGDWNIDAFIARPVEDDRGTFNDSGQTSSDFWGVYATGPAPWAGGTNVDLYYLGLRKPNATFAAGTADELRHSVGSRVFGKSGSWDYNFEGVIQWGTFGDRDILAWTLASDTGYTFQDVVFTPRAGLCADVISGNTSSSSASRLSTFNPLFPRGAYFGESAIIGPQNLIDIHPALDLKLTTAVKLSLDWDFFWRYGTGDGIYDSGGNVLRGAGGGGRYIGSQPSVALEWAVGRHTTINAAYAHFFAGEFIRNSGPSADVDYVSFWVVYRF